MSVSIFPSSSLQPFQNYVQSPGEGHMELFNFGEVFLSAFFLLFPIEMLSDLLRLPAVKIMNLGEVFLPHIYHICGG